MNLDFGLYYDEDDNVFAANITHNLGRMAKECGVYLALWRPEELLATHARHITDILEAGLARLEDGGALSYVEFSPKNGWGDYGSFVDFVRKVLDACKNNPNAKIHTWI